MKKLISYRNYVTSHGANIEYSTFEPRCCLTSEVFKKFGFSINDKNRGKLYIFILLI